MFTPSVPFHTHPQYENIDQSVLIVRSILTFPQYGIPGIVSFIWTILSPTVLKLLSDFVCFVVHYMNTRGLEKGHIAIIILVINNIYAVCRNSALQWRHNERDGVSNHQPQDCLVKHLLRRRSKKTSKLRVIGRCAGNSPGTGEFPAQTASNAGNVSIGWRHHDLI